MDRETRPLTNLVDTVDPAWTAVQDWIAAALYEVQVLPQERKVHEQTLLTLQMTTRSVLEAVAYETGGVLINHGWLRLLGSGSSSHTHSYYKCATV